MRAAPRGNEGSAMAGIFGGSNRPPAIQEDRQFPKEADAQSNMESVFEDDGEVPEVFWAKRASTIQHFYNLWDCNQLTNEAFAAQLQQILGSRANIMSPDSEFTRLTNQHRFARNLRFAQLMSALRQDAKKFRLPDSPSGGYAGSIGPDRYEPSECPSETPSQAAGRSTNQIEVRPGTGTGRKHYQPSESGADDQSDMGSVSARYAPKPRTPAPFALLSDLPGNSRAPVARSPPCFAYEQPAAPKQAHHARAPAPWENQGASDRPQSGYGKGQAPAAPRSPAPFAQGGNYDGTDARRAPPPQSASRQAVRQDPDFWSRAAPVNVGNGMRSDNVSECGQSDVMSVADSQREVFTARDRGGHGNILTWGGDSRNITPSRTREGRNIARESSGVPRAHTSAGVFPPSP